MLRSFGCLDFSDAHLGFNIEKNLYNEEEVGSGVLQLCVSD